MRASCKKLLNPQVIVLYVSIQYLNDCCLYIIGVAAAQPKPAGRFPARESTQVSLAQGTEKSAIGQLTKLVRWLARRAIAHASRCALTRAARSIFVVVRSQEQPLEEVLLSLLALDVAWAAALSKVKSQKELADIKPAINGAR